MPEEWPSFIPDLNELVERANGLCYDEGDGHRFRWEATGTTVYENVGGEHVPITQGTPWTLTVFPKRGVDPWDELKVAVAVHEDPDNPDAWIIHPTATVRRQTDLHESNPRVASRGAISIEDFQTLAPQIVTERLTPGAAWALLEPKLLASD